MFGEKREDPRNRIGKFIDEIILNEGGWREFQPHLHEQTLTLGFDFMDVFSGKAREDVANLIADKFSDIMDLPGGFRETWGLRKKEKIAARRSKLEETFGSLTAGASGDEGECRAAILISVFDGFRNEICPGKSDEEVDSKRDSFPAKMRIEQAEKMMIIAQAERLQPSIYKELRGFLNNVLKEKGGKENGLSGSTEKDGEVKPGSGQRRG